MKTLMTLCAAAPLLAATFAQTAPSEPSAAESALTGPRVESMALFVARYDADTIKLTDQLVGALFSRLDMEKLGGFHVQFARSNKSDVQPPGVFVGNLKVTAPKGSARDEVVHATEVALSRVEQMLVERLDLPRHKASIEQAARIERRLEVVRAQLADILQRHADLEQSVEVEGELDDLRAKGDLTALELHAIEVESAMLGERLKGKSARLEDLRAELDRHLERNAQLAEQGLSTGEPGPKAVELRVRLSAEEDSVAQMSSEVAVNAAREAALRQEYNSIVERLQEREATLSTARTRTPLADPTSTSQAIYNVSMSRRLLTEQLETLSRQKLEIESEREQRPTVTVERW